MRVSDPVEGDGPTEKSVGITSWAWGGAGSPGSGGSLILKYRAFTATPNSDTPTPFPFSLTLPLSNIGVDECGRFQNSQSASLTFCLKISVCVVGGKKGGLRVAVLEMRIAGT